MNPAASRVYRGVHPDSLADPTVPQKSPVAEDPDLDRALPCALCADPDQSEPAPVPLSCSPSFALILSVLVPQPPVAGLRSDLVSRGAPVRGVAVTAEREAQPDHAEAEEEVQPVVGLVQGQEVRLVVTVDREAVDREKEVDEAPAE